MVQLTCAREELFGRLQNESRREHGKLTDPRVLADMLERSDFFATLPFEPHLRIDSTHNSPSEVTAQLAIDKTHAPLGKTPYDVAVVEIRHQRGSHWAEYSPSVFTR